METPEEIKARQAATLADPNLPFDHTKGKLTEEQILENVERAKQAAKDKKTALKKHNRH